MVELGWYGFGVVVGFAACMLLMHYKLKTSKALNNTLQTIINDLTPKYERIIAILSEWQKKI